MPEGNQTILKRPQRFLRVFHLKHTIIRTTEIALALLKNFFLHVVILYDLFAASWSQVRLRQQIAPRNSRIWCPFQILEKEKNCQRWVLNQL